MAQAKSLLVDVVQAFKIVSSGQIDFATASLLHKVANITMETEWARACTGSEGDVQVAALACSCNRIRC